MSALDEYRKRCTFDVKALTELIDGGQELRQFKESVWETLRKDPLFRPLQKDLTLSDQRKITFRRTKRLAEYAFVTDDDLIECPAKSRAFIEAINCYCTSLLTAFILHSQVKIM